ncbi:MAG: T9SS type A sorting domain-containing protein [Bacteroidales bacterium]|nr:T9SS type A sorting domain-containing protein [Bacteroidales bacterium]
MRRITLIFLITVFTCFSVYTQNRWIQQYHDDLTGPGIFIDVSYDHGYLLTGWVVPNFPHYTWLTKTDENGMILWDKFLGSINGSTVVDQFKQSSSGNIYLCGGTINEGMVDPLIIKLNECGEKEWCRLILTTSDNDFFRSIVITPDGGCAALIFGAFLPLYNNRTGILKFSPDGELLWQQYYQSPDQGVDNEDLSNLILTPDHGFLMTGYCGYPDPVNPSIAWLHPYYVKVDSLGNFEWEIVLHKETGCLGGKALSSLMNPTQKYYYSCISHYYHSDTLYAKRPSLVKIDLLGNVIGVYDLVHEDYDWGTLFSAVFFNDSLLAGGANWSYNEDGPRSRAIIFDTLGNIKDSLTLLNTGWLSKTAITHDGKLLFYNTIEENGDFDTYLFKLTQDLEQDTFYTTPFIYDSLCPYQIASDTIVPDDCGVIVGVEDDDKTIGLYDGKTGGLEVWPNPCREMLNVECLMLNEGKDYSICIYDIFGRKVLEIKVPDRQNEVQINVEGYPTGIYLAVLKNGQAMKANAKFMVVR